MFARDFKNDMGYEVPSSFLQKGKLWAVLNPDGQYVGGFALVTEHPLRSLEEIPPSYPLYLDSETVGEVTAVWLKDKYYGLPWSLVFVYQVLISPVKYWVYSYPISEERLGKYYAAGDPFCLYRGPIVRLEGHPENPEPESVEILTAWGVAKIAIHRNLKYLKKLILG
jgi:hypothetical protein